MSKSPSEIIRWKHVERYFKRRKSEGYYISPQSKSRIIAGPIPKGKQMRPTVRIGEDCSFTRNAEVTKSYLNKIEDIFKVTSQDILDDYTKK